jgi:plasmid stability protein
MASITIRNLDEDLKRRLRIRAAEHGRSMEDEVREILRGSLAPADKSGPEKAETGLELFKEFRNLIEPLGGVELEPYPDEPMQIPQGFSEDR